MKSNALRESTWGRKQIIPCLRLGFLEAEPKPKILVQGICCAGAPRRGRAREAGPWGRSWTPGGSGARTAPRPWSHWAGGVLLSVSGEVSGGGTSRPEAVNQGEKAASS